MGLKETGIDQLALHSVQLGYLKILQMGNTNPNNTKAGKEIRGQASVRRAIKTSNHATCYNRCHEMHEGYQGRTARPVNQLEIHLSQPLYHARCINRGNHRSVIFRARQPITARWYSDTTNQSVTTPMIALDFSGTTHQSASRNVALKSGHHQSVNQPQDQPSDVVFSKEHQNDAASLQQLTTDSLQNNQQLVVLINSNDDVLHPLQELGVNSRHKALNQNAAFQRIKTTSRCSHDWFLKPAAGHSAGTIPHNATADSATIQQSTQKD
ncbi:hypothetical protein F511_38291 [Dorcoceras hygrometricum]|uniref:Uncharacterized protein n=1 Tax=Dorcoceras hygrometricum TaxID=472368 RepID=A0A2Z7AHA7_9LAMI|nr:hypothetical protein F511_38291 [Dorcoceras hygrometricum]